MVFGHFEDDFYRDNPKKSGIGGKPPTFVHNDFTP